MTPPRRSCCGCGCGRLQRPPLGLRAYAFMQVLQKHWRIGAPRAALSTKPGAGADHPGRMRAPQSTRCPRLRPGILELHLAPSSPGLSSTPTVSWIALHTGGNPQQYSRSDDRARNPQSTGALHRAIPDEGHEGGHLAAWDDNAGVAGGRPPGLRGRFGGHEGR